MAIRTNAVKDTLFRQAMDHDARLIEDVACKPLYPQQRTILRELLDNPYVSLDRLVCQLWGSRPDGGPLVAEKAVSVIVTQLRESLRPGFFIVARCQVYRLIWCPAYREAA